MKKLLLVVLSLCMIFSYGQFSSLAIETAPVNVSEDAGNDVFEFNAEFIRNSEMEKTINDDGTYNFTFTRIVRQGTVYSTQSTQEETYNVQIAKVLWLEEDEAAEISNVAKGVQPMGYETSILGYSCIITIDASVSKKSGTDASFPFYRIDSITTGCSVNSGTMVESMNLRACCYGIKEDGSWANYAKDFTVSTSTYTTTYPKSWPYIKKADVCRLEATFTVTAKRPSGSSATGEVVYEVI